MRVVAWGQEGTLARAKADGVATANSREAFYEECDIVSLHVRLVSGTRGLVTASDLARMKPTALFVNIVNPSVLQSQALRH